MNLYLDASALVKRYVAEAGSDIIRAAMQEAEHWFIVRSGYVETVRAVGLAAGLGAIRAIREEWPAFGVVEIDQGLVERAASLAVGDDLRSLDAIHLAAALVLPTEDLVMATWDGRLHAVARAHRLAVLPELLP